MSLRIIFFDEILLADVEYNVLLKEDWQLILLDFNC